MQIRRKTISDHRIGGPWVKRMLERAERRVWNRLLEQRHGGHNRSE